MEPKDWISLFAAIISLLAFGVATMSFWLNRRAAVTGKQPVIVFEFDQQAGWKLRNIGKGPAMNVVVSVRGQSTKWSHPVSVPSLRESDSFSLSWIGMLNVWMLGATYTDYERRPYTTVSQHDAVIIEPGRVLNKFEQPHKDYLPGSGAPRFWNAPELHDGTLV